MTNLLVNSFMNWNRILPRHGYTLDFIGEMVDSPTRAMYGSSLEMSSRQTTNQNNVQFRKKQIQPLITNLDKSRIKIGGQRWILPGDYVVHEEYGVGRYLQSAISESMFFSMFFFHSFR